MTPAEVELKLDELLELPAETEWWEQHVCCYQNQQV
jgi:hypothetical protein